MQSGFPLAVVLKSDRQRYYAALSVADKGDYPSFVNFIARSVERTLDIYLKVLTPKKEVKEKYLSLSELAKTTKFTDKYLNLLARTGKLEVHKEGRNWLTTKDALNRYLEGRARKR